MYFLYVLIAVLIINLLGFIAAFSLKSDKLTDFMYGASFFIIALYAYLGGNVTKYSTVLFILISIWSFRLAIFLVVRIFNINRDKRFDGIRENFFKFGSFWISQAIVAWVIMLPSIYFLINSSQKFSLLMLSGFVVWLLGLIIETAADLQKFTFNNNLNNKGKWIQTGLWSRSRHPNYFGEILVWVGIYLIAFDTLSLEMKFIALISPALIFILLRFVTGVPKLEQSADIKWGDNKDYLNYKNNTPLLIPKIKA